MTPKQRVIDEVKELARFHASSGMSEFPRDAFDSDELYEVYVDAYRQKKAPTVKIGLPRIISDFFGRREIVYGSGGGGSG